MSNQEHRGDEMLNDKDAGPEQPEQERAAGQASGAEAGTETEGPGQQDSPVGDQPDGSKATGVAEPESHEVLDPADMAAATARETAKSGEEAKKADSVRDAEAIAGLEKKIARLQEDVLRSHADMENLRRRAERDVANAHKFALEKFVGELVNVVDNLERATATIDPANDACKAVGEGVELTLKGLLDTLKRFQVEQIDPRGKAFNPEFHQAMTMVPHPDLAPNTVIEVFQKGYLLNGRLVRPAMVVVSRSAGQ